VQCAHFVHDRLRGLGMARGQILPFLTDFDRRLTTVRVYEISTNNVIILKGGGDLSLS